MKAPARIETTRLLLRKPDAVDAPAVFERYAGDGEVTRFLSWPVHTSLADTERFLAFSEAQWQDSPAGPYLIQSLETGQLLGSTGLAFSNADEASTGYVLARDAWGRGYATEALKAMVQLAEALSVTRLTALCHPANAASIRVLEKCGFAREGLVEIPSAFPNLGPEQPQACLRFVLRIGRPS